MDTAICAITSSLSCYISDMTQNVNPVTSISKGKQNQNSETLHELKLQAAAMQVVAFLKRNFPCAIFSGNFNVLVPFV